MTNWIVDTSVWSRIAHDRMVAEYVDALVADPSSVLVACPPQVIEYCFMARSADEYAQSVDEMRAFAPVRFHPMVDDVADIQRSLFTAGMGRSAGPIDILTAAYARLNDAIVLTADRDYDCIAQTVSDFAHVFVQPSAR